ncbi:MAG: proline--tRNA ligase [Candidatus Diapherotrites archaeon]
MADKQKGNEGAKAGEKGKSEKVTFNISKERNFSEWFTEIIKRADLADIRYNVKGFLVFQPWSVLCMERMYAAFEKELQKRGHKPYWYPALIPEKNLNMEKSHVAGFTPEVFWVTEHGAGEKLEEKLALRPTSETAFYQMFAIWIRSYKDLPFKTYQRAQVWRYETKATRPFLRSREFYWIEAHNAFATLEEAQHQAIEDMEITEEVLHNQMGVPFICFKRPQWDKFAGAVDSFGADAIMPDGKVVQQPATHLLGQNFSKPFNVKFTGKDGKDDYAYLTCFGPAMSRMFASVVATHGDDKGLRFPFDFAPLQIVIVPLGMDKDSKVAVAAKKLEAELRAAGFRADADFTDFKPGEKYYYWEMKGVPLRIEFGPREMKEKKLTVYRRDTGKKTQVKISDLIRFVEKAGAEITKNLRAEADKKFAGILKNAKSKSEIADIVSGKGIARCDFCSTELDGEACAEIVEKEFGAKVRGTRAGKNEKPKGKCLFCGKKANVVAYIAREY